MMKQEIPPILSKFEAHLQDQRDDLETQTDKIDKDAVKSRIVQIEENKEIEQARILPLYARKIIGYVLSRTGKISLGEEDTADYDLPYTAEKPDEIDTLNDQKNLLTELKRSKNIQNALSMFTTGESCIEGEVLNKFYTNLSEIDLSASDIRTKVALAIEQLLLTKNIEARSSSRRAEKILTNLSTSKDTGLPEEYKNLIGELDTWLSQLGKDKG